MENLELKLEKALLVGVIHGEVNEATTIEHLDELELLADTAGAKVVGQITQRLKKLNPQFLVGKGKADQIVGQAKELDAQLIIFDDDLSPAQAKNFMNLSDDLKVIDRSALILDIFRQHARSREAKTQVELAHLGYLLPRLTRQWTHLERQIGGIGTRSGMGETQIEIDRRLIRTRISKLKKELEKIDQERTVQSKGRQTYFRAALVGYTNAGKSTIMNVLSGADVFVEDQLFATLDTTIRQVNINDSHQVLLSDTVGFVRKLPHDLVASFRSTLKEVVDADLLLVVLDASSPHVSDHYKTIKNVLDEIDAGDKRSLIVLNKIDLVEDMKILNQLKQTFPEAVMISALDKLRLDELLKSIESIMNEDFQTVDVDIPFVNGKIISEIQDDMDVLDREYYDEGVRMTIKGPSGKIQQILSQLT
ncbi:MAG: GTPase HflX [Candidatus Marinimicrobia bacterium]|jgi:GTP-binding protein HflX|nr:GTPase HflX [Candidatus Neomarinimicrobiota bacterium]MDP7094867.1 GTPase HflX [Candidatus Neomarinimicrobiota bacterium]MDP7165312.1 GTPase HflX [Candidatus Neomarinimicrobiota bacterium]MDP7512578.1 GTPase HflX [Candidatus Neomarinimicrobiota bacterium]HJL62864.1 GTPase HflX [Candidatus Neomarinimicrobiota bacterium]|tara:strand:- start:404 stop:1666 length:1263 start_codon:yes stop_codon:yes gene_type:complete